jgi:hypothetical protein
MATKLGLTPFSPVVLVTFFVNVLKSVLIYNDIGFYMFLSDMPNGSMMSGSQLLIIGDYVIQALNRSGKVI